MSKKNDINAFAIKGINKYEVSKSVKYVNGTNNEFEMILKLKNNVKVSETLFAKDTQHYFFIGMKFYPGGVFQNYLKEHKPLKTSTVIFLTAEIIIIVENN